jgi:hypothetical protein
MRKLNLVVLGILFLVCAICLANGMDRPVFRIVSDGEAANVVGAQSCGISVPATWDNVSLVCAQLSRVDLCASLQPSPCGNGLCAYICALPKFIFPAGTLPIAETFNNTCPPVTPALCTKSPVTGQCFCTGAAAPINCLPNDNIGQISCSVGGG